MSQTITTKPNQRKPGSTNVAGFHIIITSLAIILFGATPLMLLMPLMPVEASEKIPTLHNIELITYDPDQRLKSAIRGLVVPRHHATISSRLQATIRHIGPDNGEAFKKGDRLVTFDCAIHKAELMRADAQLSAAKDAYQVKSELARNGTISKLQPVLARAELKKAEADRVLSNEHVTHCDITAPYDGRIVKRIANAHETMNIGDPLLEIVNDHEVELQLFVPSKWLKYLAIGNTFKFRVDETQATLDAKIIAVGAWIDNVSQLIEIRAICPNKKDVLIAGMSGQAEFENLK